MMLCTEWKFLFQAEHYFRLLLRDLLSSETPKVSQCAFETQHQHHCIFVNKVFSSLHVLIAFTICAPYQAKSGCLEFETLQCLQDFVMEILDLLFRNFMTLLTTELYVNTRKMTALLKCH